MADKKKNKKTSSIQISREAKHCSLARKKKPRNCPKETK